MSHRYTNVTSSSLKVLSPLIPVSSPQDYVPHIYTNVIYSTQGSFPTHTRTFTTRLCSTCTPMSHLHHKVLSHSHLVPSPQDYVPHIYQCHISSLKVLSPLIPVSSPQDYVPHIYQCHIFTTRLFPTLIPVSSPQDHVRYIPMSHLHHKIISHIYQCRIFIIRVCPADIIMLMLRLRLRLRS